ncbi:MAG TPA: stage II sporulation protein D, partial [Bacillota bacterium]|nr:stage II sporulation protein D [Bacillota bacterium]
AALNLPEKTVKKIRVKQRTASGRVGIVSFGKYQLSGAQLRTKLQLNANYFNWTVSRKGILFRVTGYGHGVGMCQYGADGMGKKGYDYQTILKHYYPGVRFAKLKY